MTQAVQTFYYPNRMARIILSAAEEILGSEDTRRLLDDAALPQLSGAYLPDDLELNVPFEAISRLQCALDERYGRSGRGVALRIGKACFMQGLRDFGPSVGLTGLEFRLLPLHAKLTAGANAFADIFNRYTDQRVRVEEDSKRLYWHIERCPICWERRSPDGCCHLATGLLHESLYWASNGRLFGVEEVSCRACGDADCTIAIEKTPLG
jgi:predicted hydrocarbon binding protein